MKKKNLLTRLKILGAIVGTSGFIYGLTILPQFAQLNNFKFYSVDRDRVSTCESESKKYVFGVALLVSDIDSETKVISAMYSEIDKNTGKVIRNIDGVLENEGKQIVGLKNHYIATTKDGNCQVYEPLEIARKKFRENPAFLFLNPSKQKEV